MTETTAGRALIEANETMDAVYVDDNNEGRYLPDIVNDNYEELEADDQRVIVEVDDEGSLRLTKMTDDGFRDGHYGTIYDVDKAAELGY